jgi:nicotinate-nucleotide pyrophosphorylase
MTQQAHLHVCMCVCSQEDAEKDAATTAGVIEFDHGEPEGVKPIILDLCKVEQKARLGCTGGLSQVKAHPYFAGFNWCAFAPPLAIRVPSLIPLS